MFPGPVASPVFLPRRSGMRALLQQAIDFVLAPASLFGGNWRVDGPAIALTILLVGRSLGRGQRDGVLLQRFQESGGLMVSGEHVQGGVVF